VTQASAGYSRTEAPPELPPGGPTRQARRAARPRRAVSTPWKFLAPSILILGLITMYPLGYAIVLSFRSGSFSAPGQLVGGQNYVALAHNSQFLHAVRFSAIFTAAVVLLSFLAGLGFALAVHKFRHGSWLLRMALLLPWVVPPVVSVLAWRWLVADNGALVNRILSGLGFQPVAFLASPFWATVLVVLIRVWRTFPFVFITLLAARLGVPDELYEAASLDSASNWRAWWHVTMPQLSGVAVISSLLVAVWSFNDFETIFLLTQGGPTGATYNVIVLAYYQAFFGGNVGLAAAMGAVGLVLLLILASVILRIQSRVQGGPR
jgi:multiple sugar transport system permease protein